MRKTLLYLTVILFLASCGAKESNDKQAELDKLKKEHADITEKIKKLEKEIADADTTAKEPKGELVVVSEINTQPFIHYIEVQGKIDAEENVIVTPQMPGVINAIYVTVGQNVSKGQVLASTDNDAMKKNVETLESQLSFAKDVYNKQKALWDQKIGSEIQFLSAKNNVETLEKSIAAANEQLTMSKLTSPINGVVDAVDIKIGQIGSPGFQGIRVVNMNTLKAKGEVSESHSSIVSAGDNAKIMITDQHKELDAKVTFASKVINSQSRTFTVEAKLPSDPLLKPNMIAVMKIADYEAENAIVVDLNMIQKSSDADYVYVVGEENGKKVAVRKTVTVGKIYGGMAEITSGLVKGDKVITSGYQNVIAGQEIQY
ncbi:MAG: efflux RND transporter periplasmic adaptor subunit [Bacteroidetes bacterium]|nr:efflux RND transporter periplasmic adaptor subunit [Bacteroidota bacterium]